MTDLEQAAQTENLLALVRTGHPAAREEIIRHTFDRLVRLARRMFRHGYPGLRNVLQTDDVFQGAALRLHQALPAVKPESAQEFFGLACQQIRRELIDLARKHLGPGGEKGRLFSRLSGTGSQSHHHALDQHATPTSEPETLHEWTAFHQAVEALPAELRPVVDLVYYKGMPQDLAAKVLGISVRTLKRRWRMAQVQLSRRLKAADLRV